MKEPGQKSRTDTELFAVPREIPRWKRVLDIVCIVLAAPFALLLGLVIAAWIKLVSRGPVFYKSNRIGHLERPFQCLKFRSMIVNADTGKHKRYTRKLIRKGGRMKKLDPEDDKRLIRMGGLLRATGLDELPQLINVWRGEMSLVGPRPCTPYEFEEYLPWHKLRFHGLPGLTGLWQVSGKNDRTFEEMIRLDLRYLRTKSVCLDLRIMAKTVPVLVAQAVEMVLVRFGWKEDDRQNGNIDQEQREAR